MTGFVYPVPTASVFVDMAQYVPLLLTAVSESLDREDVWDLADVDTALGYVGDLKLWLSLLENIMFAPVGSINQFAGSAAPSGWLLCNGAAVSRTTYDDLFSAIGTTYGVGDGVTTFNLPDLRGRTPIGAGQGSGLTNRVLGVAVGTETQALTVDQLPAHEHIQRFGNLQVMKRTTPSTGATQSAPLPTSTGSNPDLTTSSIGSGLAHNNMQPSIVLNFIIFTGA